MRPHLSPLNQIATCIKILIILDVVITNVIECFINLVFYHLINSLYNFYFVIYSRLMKVRNVQFVFAHSNIPHRVQIVNLTNIS